MINIEAFTEREHFRKNMVDSSEDFNFQPVHIWRKDWERRKKKCILATCAIRKDIPNCYDCFVGTGFLVEDFFKYCGKNIQLITSDNVISSHDLRCYSLCFKKLNGRDKKWRKLLSICDQDIFNSHGLAIVHVNPKKFKRAERLSSGLLNYRPFTMCTKEKEYLKDHCLYCHVVEEFEEKSFTTRLYKVMGIADEETHLTDPHRSPTKIDGASIYRGSQKGLGAPITITGKDGVAKAVGAITLGNSQQISFVLFSQINRLPLPSDTSGAEGGHQELEEVVAEQPLGGPVQGGGEQSPRELVEGGGEQSPAEAVERGGGNGLDRLITTLKIKEKKYIINYLSGKDTLGYFYWRSVAEELGFQYESRGWESNPIESLLKAYGEKEGSTIRGLIEATRGAGLTLSARQLERKFDTTFSSE